MKIVVIGGTGLIGSKVIAQLSALAHEAVAASPRSGVNTLTGEGLAEVLAGAAVVVDVSNSPSWADQAVMDFFRTSTTNLLTHEAAAGVLHHVALSVVGTALLQESGYFRAKLVQEDMIRQSPIPYTIVQATQFFEFVQGIADGSTQGDTIPLPTALIQPISSDDVATAVTRVAVAAPLNGTVEIGGPQAFPLDELIRIYLRSRNDARRVITDPQATYFGSALSERTLVPGAGVQLGTMRYENWLSRAATAH